MFVTKCIDESFTEYISVMLLMTSGIFMALGFGKLDNHAVHCHLVKDQWQAANHTGYTLLQ